MIKPVVMALASNINKGIGNANPYFIGEVMHMLEIERKETFFRYLTNGYLDSKNVLFDFFGHVERNKGCLN